MEFSKLTEIIVNGDFTENEKPELSLMLFHYHYNNNKIYRTFCDFLKINYSKISEPKSIPFLPVEFFKSNLIYINKYQPNFLFSSSSTTGKGISKHYYHDVKIYENIFIRCFESFFGSINQYIILALLPSYLERDGSSLIYMTNKLIQLTKDSNSGFYLYNHSDLYQKINQIKKQNKKIILWGVSFALLDFSENYPVDFSGEIIIETGGMKGRRKEIIREELHENLCTKFNVDKIYSEYGMTEMFSQCYSKGNGIFESNKFNQIFISEINDPKNILTSNQKGKINIIDFGNMFSCPFIATSDLGKKLSASTFEVSGRVDNSDMRGCNLLVDL